ncbi:MAG: ribosome-associated translation inhibitor RaiA [Candidatus Aminicenantes bacterium]|nr:ribosome-associated translation inhibitor RaiA [Candidatus Aminicenantes bacterium]
MNIKFIGRHYEVPDSLKKRIERRVAKLQRLLGENLNVEVICSLEKYRHTAEVMVKGGIFEFRATETTNDMLASVNAAFDIIEGQIKKGKEKKRSKKKGKTQVPSAPLEQVSPRIIYTQDYADKPLTVEEAIMELEATGKDVLLFRNPSTNRANVVYKKGETYYVVEPEW